jgi:hypothetical protein
MGTKHNQTGALPPFDTDEVEALLAAAASQAVFALGLVRMLTLLPLYDPALDEVERDLAAVQQSLFEAQRLLAESQALTAGEGGGRS